MKTQIDKILQEWSRQKTASPEHLSQLAGNISKKVSASGCSHDSLPGRPLFHRLAYFAAGAAAMFFLLLAYESLLRPSSRNEGNNVAAYAGIDSADIEQGRKLLHEMERLFPKQLRWIAESNGNMALGVESIANGDDDAAPMLLRLTVVSRDLDGECWLPNWCADVLMRGEKMVEVRPAKKSENSLAFWVYPLVDGKLAVEGQVSLETPIRLASRINRVIGLGETIQVASLKDDAREYRVYQTVEML